MHTLRMILLVLAFIYSPAHAAVDVYSKEGLHAWVVCYQQGLGQVSQIWINTGQKDRVLGILPGRVKRLEWVDSTKLRCEVASIKMPLYGAPNHQTWALLPPATWEIGTDGICEAVDGGGKIEIALSSETEFQKTPAKGDVVHVLKQVGDAVNRAKMAYGYLHRWDFRNAEMRYRQAAQIVSSDGLDTDAILQAPFEKLFQMLSSLAEEAKKEGSRRVCRDHLEVIGDWLLAYQQANQLMWPKDLHILDKWISKKSGQERLFRSPLDRRENSAISYVYRPNARIGEPMVMSPFYVERMVVLVRTHNGFLVQDRAVNQVQIDSLMAVGKVCTNPVEATGIFRMVTHIDPKHAEGFTQLGFSYLEGSDLPNARTAFEMAIDLDHRMPAAYNGLGLVFERHPRGRYDAIRYFRKALKYDENYLEARYNMARVRFTLKEHDAKRDLDRVISQDANFAPAFLLLGQWYETLEEDYVNAAVAYARYLALRPNDIEGRRRLAAIYVRTQDFDQIISLLEGYARDHPEEIYILPILAQACMEQGRLDWAQAYFSTFVNSAPDSLQMLYKDIQHLASPEEYAEFQSLVIDKQAHFLREFWNIRDPNLTTAANERQLEHYRRVWYALTNFSEGQYPWDRRGEVYVRFGEPDYRSRSNMVNMKQSLAVQRVKDRMAQTLYGLASTRLSYFGPVYPVRGLPTRLSGVPDWHAEVPNGAIQNISQTREARQTPMGAEEARSVGTTLSTRDDQTGYSEEAMSRIATMDVVTSGTSGNASAEMMMSGGANASGGLDLHASFQGVGVGEDASMVRWESWVYTRIGGGIEITFTDEAMTGNYDYAPPPLDASIPIRKLALFNRYNPRTVTELSSRLMPDYYVTPDNPTPLQFYYDVASFKSGVEGHSALEVYTGIPREVGQYITQEDTTYLVVERVVALLNVDTGDVFRRSGQVRFANQGDVSQSLGAIVPDVVRLEAPPGKYRMEVLLTDRMSGHQGRYRQDVVIENYHDRGLRLSGLQMAWRVTEDGPEDKFRKDDLWVVPMPTRTYAQKQNVFVYYEIYNLVQDAFGQSRYQVEYTVESKGDGMVNGVVAQLVKVFSNNKNRVAVGYEQVGTKDVQTVYTELDLGDCQAGRYILKVVVTDLNNGKKTAREALFMVAK